MAGFGNYYIAWIVCIHTTDYGFAEPKHNVVKMWSLVYTMVKLTAQ